MDFRWDNVRLRVWVQRCFPSVGVGDVNDSSREAERDSDWVRKEVSVVDFWVEVMYVWRRSGRVREETWDLKSVEGGSWERMPAWRRPNWRP